MFLPGKMIFTTPRKFFCCSGLFLVQSLEFRETFWLQAFFAQETPNPCKTALEVCLFPRNFGRLLDLRGGIFFAVGGGGKNYILLIFFTFFAGERFFLKNSTFFWLKLRVILFVGKKAFLVCLFTRNFGRLLDLRGGYIFSGLGRR